MRVDAESLCRQPSLTAFAWHVSECFTNLMEFLLHVTRERSDIQSLQSKPLCKITIEADRVTGLAGLADNDDDDYDGDGEPHKVALLRLRNTNCRPVAWSNSLPCLCHSVVRRQKKSPADQNQYAGGQTRSTHKNFNPHPGSVI